jgi:hypothetical protein
MLGGSLLVQLEWQRTAPVCTRICAGQPGLVKINQWVSHTKTSHDDVNTKDQSSMMTRPRPDTRQPQAGPKRAQEGMFKLQDRLRVGQIQTRSSPLLPPRPKPQRHLGCIPAGSTLQFACLAAAVQHLAFAAAIPAGIVIPFW